MQKNLSYNLLILFSFAFSCETINDFAKKINYELITVVTDFENEGDTSELETKDECKKKEFNDDYYCYLSYKLVAITHLNFAPLTDFVFSSSNYSQVVFSPPERT